MPVPERSRPVLLVGVVCMLLGSALAACGIGSKGGVVPTVICGTTLSDSAAGATVDDVADGGTVTMATIGGELFLRVAHGCSHGVDVSIVPADAAAVIATAPAHDHRAAAVVLAPTQDVFDVRLSGGGQGPVTVHVDLSAGAPTDPAPDSGTP